MHSDDEGQTALRIDKWLWYARFFKTRSQATDAVNGGLVHVNGERVKPSRIVIIGDRLWVTRSETRMEVLVRQIPARRGPAPEAQACYEETPDSVLSRERRREQQRLRPPAPPGRPDKHARRALRHLKGY